MIARPLIVFVLLLLMSNATDYAIAVAANNPYPAGTYKVSLDMGSTWTTRTGNALLFSTFGP